MPRKLTQEEVISKAIETHGDKLLFDKSVYVNMNTKMLVTCPIHGDFLIKPVSLIHQKQGCKYCSHQSYAYTADEFIKKANEVHHNKYTYTNVVYKNNKTKVWVTCPVHGDFEVRPDNHLHGSGCPVCGKISMGNNQKLTKDKFIELSKKIHGDKYIYSEVNYVDYGTKVCIICPKHGMFWQTPDNHLHGHSCPICKESKLELMVSSKLDDNKVLYVRQKTFPWLKYNGNLFLDFYLPNYNIAIECQGLQHYEPTEFFGGEKEFKKRVARDNVKLALCEKNGIKVIYFSNKEKENVITNIDKLMENIIK
jgi:very-short-patch-repair endonuclease